MQNPKIRKLISYEIEGNIEILLSIEVDGADATGFENNSHRQQQQQQSIGSTSDLSDMPFNFPKKPALLLPMHNKNNRQHSFQSMHSRTSSNSSNVSDLSDRSGDNSADNNLQSLVNNSNNHHINHQLMLLQDCIW